MSLISAANEISSCFCSQYNDECSKCPIGQYRISKEYAVCYYSIGANHPTERQTEQFLAIARKHWDHKYDVFLDNESLALLRRGARVV